MKNQIKQSTPADVVGLFHGCEISELEVKEAAEELWSETYGNLAALHNGANYVLHLYLEDGRAIVILEDRKTETWNGKTVCAPILSHRAEAPEWSDGSDESQEAMNEQCKNARVEEWAAEIRATLNPLVDEDDTEKRKASRRAFFKAFEAASMIDNHDRAVVQCAAFCLNHLDDRPDYYAEGGAEEGARQGALYLAKYPV